MYGHLFSRSQRNVETFSEVTTMTPLKILPRAACGTGAVGKSEEYVNSLTMMNSTMVSVEALCLHWTNSEGLGSSQWQVGYTHPHLPILPVCFSPVIAIPCQNVTWAKSQLLLLVQTAGDRIHCKSQC